MSNFDPSVQQPSFEPQPPLSSGSKKKTEELPITDKKTHKVIEEKGILSECVSDAKDLKDSSVVQQKSSTSADLAAQKLFSKDDHLDLQEERSPKELAEHLLEKAHQLAQILPEHIDKETPEAIIFHQLCDTAAEKFMAIGEVSRAFQARSLAATRISFSETHPLHKMDEEILLQTKNQSDPRFGAHFSGLDTGVLKGGHLRGRQRTINNQDLNCFQFKISSVARNELTKTVEAIKNNPEEFSSTLPDQLKSAVSISSSPYHYVCQDKDGSSINYNLPSDKQLEIEFKGIGKVIIGDDTRSACLTNEIRVELPANQKEGEGLRALHQITAVLGLGPILCTSRTEDIERMKIAQIFRAYYPGKAYELENSKEFFDIPVDKLREKIELIEPSMKARFKKYLDDSPDLIKSIKIYPGRTALAITDIGTQMQEQGAYGLMSGIGASSMQAGLEAVCRILKGDGAISTQDKLNMGVIAKGASPVTDLEVGGGDQVFCRLITRGRLENTDIKTIPFSGNVQVLYDLDVVNRGAYASPIDRYGSKEARRYSQRNNLMSFTEVLVTSDPNKVIFQKGVPRDMGTSFGISNEVMVKNRIGPEFVKGFVVQTEEKKQFLIDGLKNDKDLIERGVVVMHGKQCFIQEKPIDEFIHVADKFNKGMWHNVT